jgi:hypothetical protein
LELPQGTAVEVVDADRGDIHLLLGGRRSVPELDRIAEGADNDAAFKELLLRDPRATVERHIGSKLPPTSNVHIREAAPNMMYLYLAPSQDGPRELTDNELEGAAGGLLQMFIGALAAAGGCPPAHL